MAEIVNMKDLVETKLTKGELVELILEDMKSQIKRELAELIKERDALVKSVPLETVRDVIAKEVRVDFRFPYGVPRGQIPKNVAFYINVPREEIPLSKLPNDLQQNMRKRWELEEQIEELNFKLGRLDAKGGAKAVVLRGFLEQSNEGRALLQMLNDIKVKVNTRLLLAGK